MLYAAYGSNLHPLRLSLRLPRSRFQGTAVISGRKLCFHKRSIDESGKCNIATSEGNIHVAVYEVDSQERIRLDWIEGVGLGYFVETIVAPGFGQCFTYVAAPAYIDNRLQPYSWYKELVLAGCEVLEFPVDYVAMIRDIVAIDDPDKDRHASNMRIVQMTRLSVRDCTR